jgi:hypothetical protein
MVDNHPGVAITSQESTLTRVDVAVRCGSRNDPQDVSGNCVVARQRPGRQLDYRIRPKSSGEAPWRDRVLTLDDPAVAAHEDDIDRELHEEGMDGVAGGNQHRIALFEGRAAKKAFPAGRRVKGPDDTTGDDRPVPRVLEDAGGPWVLNQRKKEVPHA